jgi:hypothetical protein
MKRWLLILFCGHMMGSYGIEVVDALDNYDAPVPWAVRLEAPLYAPPWLVSATAKAPGLGLLPFWTAYVLPMGVTAAVGILWKSGRKRPPARGFEPLPPKEGER